MLNPPTVQLGVDSLRRGQWFCLEVTLSSSSFQRLAELLLFRHRRKSMGHKPRRTKKSGPMSVLRTQAVRRWTFLNSSTTLTTATVRTTLIPSTGLVQEINRKPVGRKKLLGWRHFPLSRWQKALACGAAAIHVLESKVPMPFSSRS